MMRGMSIRAFHAISVALPEPANDAAPPEWVELIPAGTFSGRDGRGPYTLDPQAVIGAFEKGGIDLPVDYDHQTLEAEAKAGPVPAAGWIKALEVRDGALWGRVAWTPRAAELIAAREYRFLSPVFRHDKKGRVLALEGAGLFPLGVEHLHFTDNDLRGVTIHPVLILPFPGLQLAFDVDATALVQVLAAYLREPVPGNNAVPFCLLLLFPVLALPSLRGGQGEGCHLGTALGVAQLRISAQIADEHHHVQHRYLSLLRFSVL